MSNKQNEENKDKLNSTDKSIWGKYYKEEEAPIIEENTKDVANNITSGNDTTAENSNILSALFTMKGELGAKKYIIYSLIVFFMIMILSYLSIVFFAPHLFEYDGETNFAAVVRKIQSEAMVNKYFAVAFQSISIFNMVASYILALKRIRNIGWQLSWLIAILAPLTYPILTIILFFIKGNDTTKKSN